MCLITFPAIHRSGSIWYEWNLGFLATVCTSDLVHFSRATIEPSLVMFSIHIFMFSFFIYVLLLACRFQCGKDSPYLS